MMKKNFFLISCFLLAVFTAYTQTTIYVSPNGNDAYKGSLKQPYRTIEKALSVAATQQQRVYILLRAGCYYLDTTLSLNTGNVPAGGLLLSAYKDEQVYISAGRRLQLHWQPWRNGIFRAAVPAGMSFEQLYVNGAMQVLARYPNYDSTAKVFHGTAADAIVPARVKRWQHPAGGYVHALHAHEWGGFHYRITAADTAGNLQLEGGWQNNRPEKMHKEYRFVENIFEELDAPGEWWLDKTAGMLYYYPPAGISISSTTVEVSRLKNSIELHGSAAHPLQHVQLSNLHFVHNERSFWETKEPLLRSDWTFYRGGAVLLEGTEHCSITRCSFTGIGGNAVMVSRYNQYDTISGCLITHIGANGVCFVGDTGAVRSPSFRYEDYTPYDRLDTTPGPLTNNYPQRCLVTDNLMHHLGEIEKQATGVEITIASSITVSYNSIYHTPRAGLNIGDGCFGGHVIEHNDVFNTVLETGDHGAFNSWGRDRYWSPDRQYMDSILLLHPSLVLLDAQQPITIRYNRFRCDHGWDIDLDDGSSNYHIYSNTCLNGGLKLREGFYRVVENNILINNSFHPHVWFANSGDVFRHNIVTRKYYPIQIKYWGSQVDENLFPDSTALLAAQHNGTDKHSLTGDPLFINAAAGNYTVQPNSPALKTGFHNFPQTGFGVQQPQLKQMALQPDIPQLLLTGITGNKAGIHDFLGGKIKSVENLGERSAYGLPDENGVIILDAGKSWLAASGLLEKDVLVKAGDTAIRNVQDLLSLYSQLSWKGGMSVTVIRNQQAIQLFLKWK